MTFKYESFEKKYLGEDKPLGKFGKEALIMGGGMVLGLGTIPTRIRKVWNNQTRLQSEGYKGSLSKILGVAIGFVGGACADIYAIQYAAHETTRDNYVPLGVLGVSNLASLTFELGTRFGKRWEKAK